MFFKLFLIGINLTLTLGTIAQGVVSQGTIAQNLNKQTITIDKIAIDIDKITIDKAEWKYLYANEKYIKYKFSLRDLQGKLRNQDNLALSINIVFTGSISNRKSKQTQETYKWLAKLAKVKAFFHGSLNVYFIELDSLSINKKDLQVLNKEFPTIDILHGTMLQVAQVNNNFGQTRVHALSQMVDDENNSLNPVIIIGNSYPLLVNKKREVKFVLLPNIEIKEILEILDNLM